MAKSEFKKKYNEFLVSDTLPEVTPDDAYIYAMTETEYRAYSIELTKVLLSYLREKDELIKIMATKIAELEAR